MCFIFCEYLLDPGKLFYGSTAASKVSWTLVWTKPQCWVYCLFSVLLALISIVSSQLRITLAVSTPEANVSPDKIDEQQQGLN